MLAFSALNDALKLDQSEGNLIISDLIENSNRINRENISDLIDLNESKVQREENRETKKNEYILELDEPCKSLSIPNYLEDEEEAEEKKRNEENEKHIEKLNNDLNELNFFKLNLISNRMYIF